MDFIDYTGDPRATLMHFNPNHDPRNGQFAKKSGGFGARKYQNPDGTLTPRGEARFEAEKRKNALKKKENRVKDEEDLRDPNRWDREDTENAKGIADASKKMIDELRRIDDNLEKGKKQRKFDLSSMTDSELRQKINRMQMEEQYSRLLSDRDTVPKGKAYLRETLDRAGDVMAVTSSAIAIALAIKQLKAT